MTDNWTESAATASDDATVDREWLDEIFEFLLIPSISASEEHSDDVLRAGLAA